MPVIAHGNTKMFFKSLCQTKPGLVIGLFQYFF